MSMRSVDIVCVINIYGCQREKYGVGTFNISRIREVVVDDTGASKHDHKD